MSNFWRSVGLRLINCEIKLDLAWSRNYVIPEISRTLKVLGDNLAGEKVTTGATFQINSTNFYVPL